MLKFLGKSFKSLNDIMLSGTCSILRLIIIINNTVSVLVFFVVIHLIMYFTPNDKKSKIESAEDIEDIKNS